MAAETAFPILVTSAPARRRRLPRWLRSLLRARLAAVGVVVLTAVAVSAVAAPLLAPHDPKTGELIDSKIPPAWTDGGMRTYPLGTDMLGRDIFSRMIYGARISLIVGFTAVAIAGAIGISAGLVSGYYRGIVDNVLMRLVEIQLAVPFILFALAILAVLGPGLRNLILVLGLTGWVTYARVVRGQVLSYREKEFVEAARALGAGDLRIMFRHILPNTFASVIVIGSFAVAGTILAEASLSFLGLGVPPSTPTWGGMVADGREQILNNRWWMYIFPGAAIMLTVLAINSVGDWLRDFLDPRLRL
ncbi:MAG: ABC transporter permease [Chloroflexi bacterium]|nr:ABC transporter permease [Chloroflexota bacterium]